MHVFLQITALPFYNQTWFVIVVLFVITLLITWFFIRQKRAFLRLNNALEITVQERTNALQTALQDREILLKEIHHRVKNNLQVISSLLELQSSRLTDDLAKSAFREAQNRIMSIAIVHQNLYQHDKLDAIEFRTFANGLIDQVKTVFKRDDCRIDIQNRIGEELVDVDTAVALGLILNELLTNSFKYAFANRSHGKIEFQLENTDGENYMMIYNDDGPGLPAESNLEKSNSMGLRLIRNLSRQIGGKAMYHKHLGCKFSITFQSVKGRKQKS